MSWSLNRARRKSGRCVMGELERVECSQGHSNVVNRSFEEQLCGGCGERV